jgi:hypothetical protein
MGIQLQFVRANDPMSRAIAWFGHGEYSHVDVVMPAGTLLGARSDRVGGAPPGVQIRSPEYADWALVKKVWLQATPVQLQVFYKFLTDQIGKPYDKRAIMGFIAGRDWREPDAWFCSELIAAALEYCHWFPYELCTPTNKVDPSGLLLAVSARSKV